MSHITLWCHPYPPEEPSLRWMGKLTNDDTCMGTTGDGKRTGLLNWSGIGDSKWLIRDSDKWLSDTTMSPGWWTDLTEHHWWINVWIFGCSLPLNIQQGNSVTHSLWLWLEAETYRTTKKWDKLHKVNPQPSVSTLSFLHTQGSSHRIRCESHLFCSNKIR